MASSSVTQSVRDNNKLKIRQPKPQITISTTSMQWSCRACTLKNSVTNLVCDACGTGRHNIPEIEAVLVVEHKKVVAQVPAVKLTKLPVPSKKIAPDGDVQISKPGETVPRKVLQGLDNISGSSTKKLTKTQEAQVIGGIKHLTLIERSEAGTRTSFPHHAFEKKEKVGSTSFSNFWSCEACTLLNQSDVKTCSACGTLPPTKHTASPSPAPTKQVEKSVVSRRKSNDPRGPVKPGVKETYENILSTCEELDEEFVDDSFPPGPSALFIDGKGPAIINGQATKLQVPQFWLRPSEISWNDLESRTNTKRNWSVMCDPTPSDIYQGSLGDCWLIGSLAMITERRELLDNIIRINDINQAGAYIIRLNHFGKWKDVIVDDLLPCDQYKRLIYAKAKRKQLWVPLIEKAMAKLHGSYEALIGGSNSESLTTLTGFPSNTVNLNSSKLDFDLTWAQLVSSASAGFLIGTGTHGRDLEKMAENERMGLKPKHAYSILEVNDEWGPKLIKLRNPWGKDTWSGQWCSTSPLWTPIMKMALNRSATDKGTFWMCFEDFVKHFEVLDICRIRQNWEYNSFQGLLVPYADRVSHPCFAIKVDKPTELDITLFQSSWLRHQKKLNSTVADVALVILKSNSCSDRPEDPSEAKNWKLVEYTERVKERDVNLNLMIDPGNYKLIPVSFGHWTNSDDNSERFLEFEMSIHSSKSITCLQVQPPSYLLADLIIKIGLKCCEAVKTGDPSVVLYHNQKSPSFGKGSLYIGENRHKDRWIVLEIDLELSENVFGTRNLKTMDCIPPNSRQIINVLTVNNHLLSYKFSFSLRTLILSSRDHSPNLNKFGYNGTHFPELTSNNSGLHTPRPII